MAGRWLARLGLGSLIASCAVGVLAWNATPILRATQVKPRTKVLSFLPSPTAARLLCLGHANSFAKLRWIDSFAYMEWQFLNPNPDDTVRGTGASTYEQLYRTLIALDPRFPPFYAGAFLNLGGVVSRHPAAMRLFLEGTLSLPHSYQVWAMGAGTLVEAWKLNTSRTWDLEAYLATWAQHMREPAERELVDRWLAGLGRTHYRGLEQLPYWSEQLRLTRPGSPAHEFVLLTVREQLSRFGRAELQALLQAGPQDGGLAACLEPVRLAARYPRGLPALGPIRLQEGRPVLAADAFGYAYTLEGGRVQSPGLLYLTARRSSLARASASLEAIAHQEGRWPADLDAARGMGVELRELPPGCAYELKGRELDLALPPRDAEPWTPAPLAQGRDAVGSARGTTP